MEKRLNVIIFKKSLEELYINCINILNNINNKIINNFDNEQLLNECLDEINIINNNINNNFKLFKNQINKIKTLKTKNHIIIFKNYNKILKLKRYLLTYYIYVNKKFYNKTFKNLGLTYNPESIFNINKLNNKKQSLLYLKNIINNII